MKRAALHIVSDEVSRAVLWHRISVCSDKNELQAGLYRVEESFCYDLVAGIVGMKQVAHALSVSQQPVQDIGDENAAPLPGNLFLCLSAAPALKRHTDFIENDESTLAVAQRDDCA